MPSMIRMVEKARPLEVQTGFTGLADADPDVLFEHRLESEDSNYVRRTIVQKTGTFSTANFITLNRGDILEDQTDTTPAYYRKETDTDDDNFALVTVTT